MLWGRTMLRQSWGGEEVLRCCCAKCCALTHPRPLHPAPPTPPPPPPPPPSSQLADGNDDAGRDAQPKAPGKARRPAHLAAAEAAQTKILWAVVVIMSVALMIIAVGLPDHAGPVGCLGTCTSTSDPTGPACRSRYCCRLR